MNTDELVKMLARGTVPVESNASRRRFAAALGWGAFATALAMAILLGVRSDIMQTVAIPMFWVKLAFPALVASSAWYAATRLARPGTRLGRAPAALVMLMAAVWTLAVVSLINAEPGERRELVFGDTWFFCIVSIPLLSIPVFVALMWAMKGLAPTSLRLAGGAAGLLAGAVSATVYALHCPELGAPFIAIWYVAGMLIPALGGAAIGPRLLRW